MGNYATVRRMSREVVVLCELETLGNMGRLATMQQLAGLVGLAKGRGIDEERIGIAIARGCIRRCMNGGTEEDVAPVLRLLRIRPELVLAASATIRMEDRY